LWKRAHGSQVVADGTVATGVANAPISFRNAQAFVAPSAHRYGIG
jgi:hypothetical protein